MGWAACLLGAMLVLLAGCASQTVPEGWQQFDVNGLQGAYPGDWQPRAEEQRAWPDAFLEVAGPANGSSPGPVMVVFAEVSDSVIAAEDRATLITSRLEAEFDAELVGRLDPRVRGAGQGLALEFAFDADAEGSGDPVPSRQLEVILDARDGRTFDIILGGPVDVLDQPTIDGVLDALLITDAT